MTQSSPASSSQFLPLGASCKTMVQIPSQELVSAGELWCVSALTTKTVNQLFVHEAWVMVCLKTSQMGICVASSGT